MGCPLGPAARLEAICDPVIPQLGEWMRHRPDTLSMAQGMVDWAPPPAVRQAVLEALEGPVGPLDRYGDTWGEPELLALVNRQLRGTCGLDLDGALTLVKTGSNMAFAELAQVICDPGSVRWRVGAVPWGGHGEWRRLRPSPPWRLCPASQLWRAQPCVARPGPGEAG